MTGRRKRNEDAYFLDPELGVFAVIDGMGGYAGGEIASSLAAETIGDFFHSLAVDPEGTWPYALDCGKSSAENRVDAALRLANRRIRQRRCGDVCTGDGPAPLHYSLGSMGATVAMISLGARGAVLGHLGDSRIYRLRGRGSASPRLEQLTRDHSLYEQLLEGGVDLPPLEEFAHSNVVTRALGPAEDERPELNRIDLCVGDRFLLCTDGLTGSLDHGQLAALLDRAPIDEASALLAEAAFDAGSRDNITVIVVDVARSA